MLPLFGVLREVNRACLAKAARAVISCVLMTLAAPVLAADAAGSAGNAASHIPVAEFATLPNYRGIQLSPNGASIAYRVTHERRSVIIVQSVHDHDDMVAIPPFENAEIRWFRWANDDMLAVSFSFSGQRFFYNGRAILGGRDSEETRFFAYHRDGGNRTRPVRLAKPEGLSGTRSPAPRQ